MPILFDRLREYIHVDQAWKKGILPKSGHYNPDYPEGTPYFDVWDSPSGIGLLIEGTYIPRYSPDPNFNGIADANPLGYGRSTPHLPFPPELPIVEPLKWDAPIADLQELSVGLEIIKARLSVLETGTTIPNERLVSLEQNFEILRTKLEELTIRIENVENWIEHPL